MPVISGFLVWCECCARRQLVLASRLCHCMPMSDRSDMQDGVCVHLSAYEANVLFGLLSRWIDEKDALTRSSRHFETPSECAVLHGILCDLEKQLSAPQAADYRRIVQDARERLAYRWDGTNLRK